MIFAGFISGLEYSDGAHECAIGFSGAHVHHEGLFGVYKEGYY